MEIQQSALYASYIRSLGWIVEKLDGSYIFIKPFPVIGGLAKIQRVTRLPTLRKLLPILRRYSVRTLAIEPDSRMKQGAFTKWCRTAAHSIRLNRDPFIPTKTIRVDVTQAENEIFLRFSEAKRRAVRRAEKNGVTVSVTKDIDALIRLKNRSAGFLGFITTTGAKKLWHALADTQKAVLLARGPDAQVVGGIMLISWNRISYYWIAGALPQGKKLFAPTLLVWEALKESKKLGCKALDFVGVWDERLANKNPEWKGFTKFKEGFGGETLYYPIVK
ncbi:MAG: peptidoglycan bridge formation glycyltransferase FemA/FemB family protein [Patescibacteria group bacterium]